MHVQAQIYDKPMWQKIAKEIFANTGAARKTNNN
jgi:hypothetical protein